MRDEWFNFFLTSFTCTQDTSTDGVGLINHQLYSICQAIFFLQKVYKIKPANLFMG